MVSLAPPSLSVPLPIFVEEYTFKKSVAFRHPQRVYNVIPGDFTQDGRLDLLVYSQSANSNEISVQLYVALPKGEFGECSLSIYGIRERTRRSRSLRR